MKTVAAIATSPGESAIGIVRMSGPDSLTIIEKIFTPKSQKSVSDYDPRTMIYGHIKNKLNSIEQVLDEVLVVYFKGPYSYTGEDSVEIFCHGNFIALKEVLHLLIKSGAELAQSGEFTKRAFLNGRIDLSQAESVMDIISSKTKKSFHVAVNQLQGSLGKRMDYFSEILTDLLAQIEVIIDYPDEDIEIINRQDITQTIYEITEQMSQLVNTYDSGRIIKEGLSLVIIGRPNVGKSTLLNALLRDTRAIVTDIAGTTRDIIEESANLRGIPIRLIDTAGIRETDDLIERIGVDKTKEMFNKSDMAIFVLNASEPITQEDQHVIEIVSEKKCIVVINKIDLDIKIDLQKVKELLPTSEIVMTSLLSEDGVKVIEDSIEQFVLTGSVVSKDSDILTNSRHFQALTNAMNSLKSATEGLELMMPLDIIEIDLQNAYQSIGEITGKTVHEDVINRIFERFCLGK